VADRHPAVVVGRAESQFESYRRLGEYLMSKLYDEQLSKMEPKLAAVLAISALIDARSRRSHFDHGELRVPDVEKSSGSDSHLDRSRGNKFKRS
jgi:hypothetical protein